MSVMYRGGRRVNAKLVVGFDQTGWFDRATNGFARVAQGDERLAQPSHESRAIVAERELAVERADKAIKAACRLGRFAVKDPQETDVAVSIGEIPACRTIQ